MSTLVLTSEDVDHLQGALRALLSPLDAEDVNSWRAGVTGALQKLFHTDQASFTLEGADPVSFVAGLDASFGRDYVAFYHQVDEGAKRRREHSLDVFNRAQLFGNEIDSFHRTSRIYNELYRPHDYNDAVGLWLEQPESRQHLGGVPTNAVLTVAHEHYGTERFGEWGLFVMRLLQPALQSGVEGLRRFAPHKTSLARILDSLDTAVMLFDHGGRVLHQNPAMTRLLESDPQKDSLIERMNQAVRVFVTGTDRRARSRFDACEARLGACTAAATDLFTRSARYQMRICCVGCGEPGLQESILVTVSSRRPELPPAEEIMNRFGLTRRETEVAALLVQRKRTQEIANELHISIHTARRHTENVMAKLDVHSRVDISAALSLKS